MPLIDIVIPIYNVEQYLARCIDSVLAQTFTDYRLILVDDGSPDRCGEICEKYAAEDPRIHVIHRENGGLSAARNTGIDWAQSESDSEWITFVDSDDWIHPDYLEQLFAAVQTTGLSIAVTGFLRTECDEIPYEKSTGIQARVLETEEFYCEDKLTATIACGKLYRKEDFSNLRYPVGKIHEDELTTYKILFRYNQIAYISHTLYYYFQNSVSIMRSGWSPRHISEAEGMEDQLRYFLEHSYPRAASCAAKSYLNSIYRNLTLARAAGRQYTQEVVNLRKRLRIGLHIYGKLAGTDPHKTPWLFYEAFPVRSIPVRAWKKIHAKF